MYWGRSRARVMFKAGLTGRAAVGIGQLSTFSAADGWTLSLLGLVARTECGLEQPAEGGKQNELG